MTDKPLPVAISALINENRILLIKRIKGDYIDYWSLPGGKIEKSEHVSDAAIREIKEETGIDCVFKSHLGFVSEHLIENDNISKHFLLHVCELCPKTTVITNESEGKLEWFDLNILDKMKEEIIPSDFLMIKNFIQNKTKNYFNCVIHKDKDNHILKKFE